MINNFGEAVAYIRDNVAEVDFKGRFDDTSMVARIKGELTLIQFKRDFYHNFPYHFPNVVKADGTKYGWAQIMSLSSLNRALIEGITKLIFITPDKKIYTCYSNLFKKFYLKNKTDVPHLEGEIAMPLDFFERVNVESNNLDNYG